MHFNLLIPVFPVLWLNTIWIFPMSKFPSDPGFLLISAFVLLAQWSLCFLLFPNLSFLVGVLSVSLRFSSRVIYLKSVPVVPPITVIQILLPSGYCNISFGPHSPLSPAKANFHCPLSSLFYLRQLCTPFDVCFQFPTLLSCNFQCTLSCPLQILQETCPFPEEPVHEHDTAQQRSKTECLADFVS